MSSGKMLLLIDGPNLYGTAKSLGFDIDYKKLLQEFRSRGDLLRANYYTALNDDDEFSAITPLIDWLDYNGYSVISKPVKSFTDAEGRRKNKGNMGVEIAVDAMEMAPHVKQMVLFSGDGDFRSLVEAVQRRGVYVTVASSISSNPSMCSAELRRQADAFLEITDLQAKISRDPGSRAARDRGSVRRGRRRNSGPRRSRPVRSRCPCPVAPSR